MQLYCFEYCLDIVLISDGIFGKTYLSNLDKIFVQCTERTYDEHSEIKIFWIFYCCSLNIFLHIDNKYYKNIVIEQTKRIRIYIQNECLLDIQNKHLTDICQQCSFWTLVVVSLTLGFLINSKATKNTGKFWRLQL